MDASKVTIEEATLAVYKPNRAQKRRLQEKKVIEYLQSLPYGRIVDATDIGELLGVSKGTAAGLVRGLMERGRLIRESRYKENGGRKAYSYTVAGPVKTRPLETEPEPETSAPLAPPPVVSAEVKQSDLTAELIRQLQALGVGFRIVIESKPSENTKEDA